VRSEVAEGDRVCAELKRQLDPARRLVREAQVMLAGDARRPVEPRSFRREPGA
jgi:hypothetical protein